MRDAQADCRPSAGLTRRATLTRLGVGGLAAALAIRGSVVAAQDATPGVADLPPTLQEWFAGWEALDPDRIVTAYAEDGSREDVPTNTTQTGRDAIRAYLAATFGALTNGSSQFVSVVAAGDWVAVEWVLSGTYTGQAPGLPPGTGQSVTLRGVEVLELRDGLIVRDRGYYDLFGLLVQVGVIPAPTASPVASPATT